MRGCFVRNVVALGRYTRRFLGGRQPLWGSGVTSSMPVTLRPAFWSWRTACSRPAPGPFTLTSISIIPLLRASEAAFSAARPAANGVLLRAPLNPTVPADAHEIVSPFKSVIVTIVLLNVALMWATPLVTPLRIFFLTPAFAAAPVVFAASAMDLYRYLSSGGSSGTTPSPPYR